MSERLERQVLRGMKNSLGQGLKELLDEDRPSGSKGELETEILKLTINLRIVAQVICVGASAIVEALDTHFGASPQPDDPTTITGEPHPE